MASQPRLTYAQAARKQPSPQPLQPRPPAAVASFQTPAGPLQNAGLDSQRNIPPSSYRGNQSRAAHSRGAARGSASSRPSRSGPAARSTNHRPSSSRLSSGVSTHRSTTHTSAKQGSGPPYFRPTSGASKPTKQVSQLSFRPTSGASTPTGKQVSQPSSRSTSASTPTKQVSQPASGASTNHVPEPTKDVSQLNLSSRLPPCSLDSATVSGSLTTSSGLVSSQETTSEPDHEEVTNSQSYACSLSPSANSAQPRSRSVSPYSDNDARENSWPVSGNCSQDADDSKSVRIFIDNSNLWINAQQVAAKNMIPKKDHRVSFDLVNLTDVIRKGRKIADCKLYGSEPPHVDKLWKKLEEYGCTTNIYERSRWTGKEKEVDTAMTADIVATAYEEQPATIAVVSGDSDFRSGIEKALKRGWKVEVYSWKQALASRITELSSNVNVEIIYLDNHLDDIIFVTRKFKRNEGQQWSSSLKGVLMHMRHNFFTGHEPTDDWCKVLEKISQWPFRYCWLSATSDDLLLVFKKKAHDISGQLRSFDIDNFLQQLYKDPPAGMEDIGLYHMDVDTEEGVNDCDKRCPHKFCCQYGDEDCYYQHTDEEKRFFEQNGGVGLPRRKVLPCKKYTQDKCPKEAKDCTLAHGDEDALCPNCGKSGHFEYNCKDND